MFQLAFLWIIPEEATPPVIQHTGAKVQLYCLPFSRQCSGAPNRFLTFLTNPLPSSGVSSRAALALPSTSEYLCSLYTGAGAEAK